MSKRFWTVTGLVLMAAAARLLPHPANFTPVAAMALFGAAGFSDRRLGFGLPVAAMLLSDLALAVFFLGGETWNAATPFVYGAFVLVGLVGMPLRGRISPLRVGGASVASAVVFFIVTNLAVWMTSGMYPLTPSGLIACYTAAIPFFGRTLASTVLYAAALFGGLTAAEKSLETTDLGAQPSV
jgi:hypothetical protein